MKLSQSLFVILALSLPLSATAFDPGQVTLAVEDRSAGKRSEALVEGLHRVLVRLTGMRYPEQSPAVAALLEAEPARWVVQYSYAEADTGTTEEGEDVPGLVLSATFDVEGLAQRLASAGAPVWGTERPPVLLWLVEQGPGRGEFVGRDSRGQAHERVREAATERGLPIILPRLDGNDRSRVRPADVRGLFNEPVMEASRHYEADLVATAVWYQSGEGQLRWRVFEDGQQVRQGDIQGGQGALPAELVHRLADYVADLYAVRSGSGRVVTLRIRALSDLADWKAARDHLAGLAGMESLHVQQLDGTTATFTGRFAGNPEQLERLVRLQPAMERCSSPDGVAETPAPTPGAAAGGAAEGVAPANLEFCWSHDG